MATMVTIKYIDVTFMRTLSVLFIKRLHFHFKLYKLRKL
jgi:hypothetical protein